VDPNHPLAAEILGTEPESEPAENVESTVYEVDEGAPELSQALDYFFSPDSETDDDGTQDGAETPGIVEAAPTRNVDEEIAQRDAYIQRLEAERNRAFMEREQAAIAAAAQAWQEQERQVIESTNNAQTWDEARNTLVSFYQNQMQQITGNSAKAVRTAYAGSYVSDVVQKMGLDKDDEALLRSLPPEAVPAVAQSLKSKNDAVDQRFKAIETELQQAKRARQNQRSRVSGQFVPSGQPRIEAPRQQIAKGSVDHTLGILALVQAEREQKRRNGRA
jgi:hypothetical protein